MSIEKGTFESLIQCLFYVALFRVPSIAMIFWMIKYNSHVLIRYYTIGCCSGRPITFFSYRPIPIMTDNCNFLIGRYRCRYRLIIPISADTDTDYWYIYVIEQRQFLDNNFHMNIELMIYWDFAINSKNHVWLYLNTNQVFLGENWKKSDQIGQLFLLLYYNRLSLIGDLKSANTDILPIRIFLISADYWLIG